MFRSAKLLSFAMLLSAPAVAQEFPQACSSFDGASGGTAAGVCLLCPLSNGEIQFAATSDVSVTIPGETVPLGTCAELSLVGICGRFPEPVPGELDPCQATQLFLFSSCTFSCTPISQLDQFIEDEVAKAIAASSSAPTASPTGKPSLSPTVSPTGTPTVSPTAAPTASPTTSAPSKSPTVSPTGAPTVSPTGAPTASPTTSAPSKSPTAAPTGAPTVSPTAAPTASPTTSAPSKSPTAAPTGAPTVSPTAAPTASPTTSAPSKSPTAAPTGAPTVSPTGAPTASPTTSAPSKSPTAAPTGSPTTLSPTGSPTQGPTGSPTEEQVLPLGLDFSTISLPENFEGVLASLESTFTNAEALSMAVEEFLDNEEVQEILVELPPEFQEFVSGVPPFSEIIANLTPEQQEAAGDFISNLPLTEEVVNESGGGFFGQLFGN